ncbi:hypothetical protein FB451DRAFT_1191572 [Mycena latifolia]|nr:hypothetical protein FB451DRAFT_1191572 [Mycena latifolia]
MPLPAHHEINETSKSSLLIQLLLGYCVEAPQDRWTKISLEDDDNASTYADLFRWVEDIISREGKGGPKISRERKVWKEMGEGKYGNIKDSESTNRWRMSPGENVGSVDAYSRVKCRGSRARACGRAARPASSSCAVPSRRGRCTRWNARCRGARASATSTRAPHPRLAQRWGRATASTRAEPNEHRARKSRPLPAPLPCARADRQAGAVDARTSAEPHRGPTHSRARAVTCAGRGGRRRRAEGEDAGSAQGRAPHRRCRPASTVVHLCLDAGAYNRMSVRRAPTRTDGAQWYAARGRTATRRAGSRTARVVVPGRRSRRPLDARSTTRGAASRACLGERRRRRLVPGRRCVHATNITRTLTRTCRDGSASGAVPPASGIAPLVGASAYTRPASPTPPDRAKGKHKRKTHRPHVTARQPAAGRPEICISPKRRVQRERQQRREKEGKKGDLPCAVDRTRSRAPPSVCKQAPPRRVPLCAVCKIPSGRDVDRRKREGRESRGTQTKKGRDGGGSEKEETHMSMVKRGLAEGRNDEGRVAGDGRRG